ncbi:MULTISPECIES: hypothetical protein [Klebsiella pneumoniae complex]|uniref:hypothetical protein n=1 Tax=Klebsiella pneumoniae TaxID=573 RepID=UPI000A1740A5|nr:hypothetical protein [Klebsiella pneumoniae]
MSKYTGGPAFPELGNVGYNSDWQNEPGMTLRDYFAAKAMQSVTLSIEPNEQKLIATAAYQMADAMLKAREEV